MILEHAFQSDAATFLAIELDAIRWLMVADDRALQSFKRDPRVAAELARRAKLEAEDT
jgi:hypothetical protein